MQGQEVAFSKQDHVLFLDFGEIGAITYSWPTEAVYVGKFRETDEHFIINKPQETTKDKAGEDLHRLHHRHGGTCSSGAKCKFL